MSISYLKMPDTVVLDETSYTNTFGKFSLEPLERGYGVTLGNSIRRVLLSSLLLLLLNSAVYYTNLLQSKDRLKTLWKLFLT